MIINKLNKASDAEIERAYKYCARIAKKSAGNFYWTFLTLPKKSWYGMVTLYAFCRLSDDAVDNQFEDNANRLQKMRWYLDLVYDHSYCDDMTLALADVASHFKFERQHFDDLILGLESDLKTVRFKYEDELELYCYRVASTVGLLCLKIFNADTDHARSYAIELGKAMQLTNILRDIKEDYKRDRVYIPEEHLLRFGLSSDSLFSEGNELKLKELILWEVQKARDKFNFAAEILPKFLKRKLVAARAMGAIYRAILESIALAKNFDHRIEISKFKKLFIIGKEIFA